MSDGLLLDTHTWLWLELGVARFSLEAKLRIGRAAMQGILNIAAISLHEIAYADLRKRVQLGISLQDWFDQVLKSVGPRILPITPEFAIASAALPLDFHGDPADRLIAATAMLHNLTLCTHDERLLHFGTLGVYDYLEI